MADVGAGTVVSTETTAAIALFDGDASEELGEAVTVKSSDTVVGDAFTTSVTVKETDTVLGDAFSVSVTVIATDTVLGDDSSVSVTVA